MRLAFVANFAAELELAAPGYAPSTRMTASLVARTRAFVAQLGGDVVTLIPGRPATGTSARGAAGLCWCPTPSALRLLAQAGARVPAAPSLDVLQRVNHRAFASTLSPLPRDAAFVRTLEDLDRHLARLPPDQPVVLKRPFGFAGRARKRLARADALEGPDQRWAEASMTQYGGGLMVEPWRTVRLDVALHGFVARDGKHKLGTPTVPTNDADGGWVRSRLAHDGDLEPAEDAQLRDMGARVAGALATAGYFGPFGIDAYRFEDPDGQPRFQPLSDLNARLTMGWCVGMGASGAGLLVEVA